MEYLFIIGRHPQLAAAEIAAVVPTLHVEHSTPYFLLGKTDTAIANEVLHRLGGTERLAVIRQQMNRLPKAEELLTLLPATTSKINLGISSWVPGIPIERLGRDVKKLAAEQNRKVRFIPPRRQQQLNAAQVIFNKLTRAPHLELVIVKTETTYYLAQTIAVQDIQAYERRDTSRPARDPVVGMLPPKLAQMMLNLATGGLPTTSPLTILDPFCGLGTIVQEGWLMGHQMLGSDKEATMISGSQANLAWLAQQFSLPATAPELSIHDVREAWPERSHETIDAVVTEPYLGPPLSSPLPSSQQKTVQRDLAKLYLEFFKNVRPLLKPAGRILIALPAWRQSRTTYTLFPNAFLDEVRRLGYRARELSNTSRETLVYARPDALVGRELTLWEKTN